VTFDVAIIGAGIVGAACADECARRGLSVAVIEARIPAGGATAAGMGHIVAMDDSEAQFALTSYSRDLWTDLSAHLPRNCEFTSSGTLWVAADDEEMGEVLRKRRFYSQRDVASEILDGHALRSAEPYLRHGLAGGLLVPGDSVVYPPCAASFLLERSRATRFSGQARLTERNQVHVADGPTISAGAIVNAAGIHAPELTPEIPIAIQPRKGHLVITDRYPGFVRHQLVELGYLKSAHSTTADSVAFNIQPRSSGQILIGSSRQYGENDPSIDEHILSAMLRRAADYMPEITRLSAIRGWTGFRAATPDKLPVIGPCPGRKNVWIAAGHEGLGITTSLGTAHLLADQILGQSSAIPIEPYLPQRANAVHA
jgi:glycine/D-amino acid oxidase-like deaminating enzyme